MNDQQLLRYSRHILLDEIDIEGQNLLLKGHALIIGMGGLGSPAAIYLAASGVGKLTLCDHDVVDLSNLQRQIIHGIETIGHSKVISARARIQEINPEVQCVTLSMRVDATQLLDLVAKADVVLDCSDNFATRYAVNRACLAQRKPLISGAVIQFHGQICVFDFRREAAPCYNCLFPEDSAAVELRCATTGVFAPLAGIIGSLQAAEALKLLMDIIPGLHGKLLAINALNMQVLQTRFAQDKNCPVCK